MADFYGRKKESPIMSTINCLIYDYLVKMKYDQTAKAFSTESGIKEYTSPETPPALLQWYSAFHEISLVRCGMSPNMSELSRIEGIMLKLENEKKRFHSLGRVPEAYYEYKKKEYILKDVMCLRLQEGRMMASCISKQAKYLFVSFQNRNLSVVNLLTGKVEVSTDLGRQVTGLKTGSSGRKDYQSTSIGHPTNTIHPTSIGHPTNTIHQTEDHPHHQTDPPLVHPTIVHPTSSNLIVLGECSREIVVMKYSVKECRLEILFLIKASEIVSYDIKEENILVLESSGVLKVYDTSGKIEKEEILGGGIEGMIVWEGKSVILRNKERVYMYDYELNMEMKEMAEGEIEEIRKCDDYLVIITKERLILYDKKGNKVKNIKNPMSGIKGICVYEGDMVISNNNEIMYESGGGMIQQRIPEGGYVGIDSINIFKRNSVVTCGVDGECKIWVKHQKGV